jgi:hypothetical protein
MVMPLREQASQFFNMQNDYLQSLAMNDKLQTKSNVTLEGPSKFEIALKDFQMHTAYNSLDKHDEILKF